MINIALKTQLFQCEVISSVSCFVGFNSKLAAGFVIFNFLGSPIGQQNWRQRMTLANSTLAIVFTGMQGYLLHVSKTKTYYLNMLIRELIELNWTILV